MFFRAFAAALMLCCFPALLGAHQPIAVQVEVRGVAVQSEDQQPIAGCVVRVLQHPFTPNPNLPEAELARTTADAAGAFSMSLEFAIGFYELRLEHPGRCQTGRVLTPKLPPPASPGEKVDPVVVDLGQIALLPGREVRGRVVDENGKGVADAAICVPRVKGVSEHLDRQGGAGLFVRTKSDADGNFSFARYLPAGTYRILWEQPLHRKLLSPLSFDVALEAPAVELELRTELLPTISGTIAVTDIEAGTPFPFPELELVGTSGKQIYRVKVDATGAFRIQSLVGDKGPVLIDIRPGATNAYQHPQAVPWGTKDLVLTIESSGSVEVEVVEAGTGTAIELFAAVCIPMDGDRPMQPIVWPAAAKHSGGKATVNKVPLGDVMLHVWAPGKEYATAKQLRFTRKAGETPKLRFEFDRKQ